MTHEISKQSQLATGPSAEFLRTVIDTIADVLIVIDRQHRVVLANRAARNMVGGRDPVAEGLTCHQAFHHRSTPCSDPRRPCPLERVVATKARVNVTHANRDAGGNRKIVRITADPVFDESGEVVRVIEWCHDITPRRQAEEALRQSEAMYRAMVESTSEGIVVCRAINGGRDFIIVGFNAAAERIEKVAREEVIGRGVTEVFPAVAKFGLFDAFKRVWRTGSPEHHPLSPYEDGRLAGWRENFIYKLPSGEIVAVYSDQTARKQVERTLRNSQEKLRLIFEQANDGINISCYDFETYQRRLVSCNRKYVEMSGYTLDELAATENLNLLSIYHHSDDERAQWDRYIRDGRPFSGTASWKRPDGKENYYEWTAAPITIGEEVLIVGVDRDVTERRQTEQRLQAYRERLQALASELIKTGERERRGIATYLHDTVAQSLALAVLKIGELKDASSGADLRDDLEEVHNLIRRSVQQARSLILDLSPPALYEAGLREAIRELADRMQAAHDIAIAVEDDGRTRLADHDRRVTVFRATQELLANVVKHAGAGQVRIAVQRDGRNMRVTVQDDGTGYGAGGVPPEEKAAGGFGLFSIRESIAALGGRFEIRAGPGRGTRATLIVPLQEETAPPGEDKP